LFVLANIDGIISLKGESIMSIKTIQSIEDLVKLLVERRKELEISQADLARIADLSINGISKFESNHGEREVKLSTLFKLSKFLGFKIQLEFEE
jgi:predicted transcriptional regulator